jgi:hypothetical protein
MIAVVFIATLVILCSCKDTSTNDSLQEIVFPASNVSYTQHMEPLFMQKCAISGCHTTGNLRTALDLTTPSYTNLMNYPLKRLVITYQSSNSILVQQLEGKIAPRMPYNRDTLNSNQMKGIKKWIDEGANYN